MAAAVDEATVSATSDAPAPLPTSEVLFARAPLRLTLWIVLAVGFLGTWLTEPYLIGRGQDWAYFVHHTTAAARTWTEFHQLPLWNPWFCGGLPALANIQTDALAPDLLLTLPFDVPVALSLRFLLFLVLGLEGAWRYARHHALAGFGAVAAAAVFVFSGRFMMVFWDGHLPFMTFALAPWVFLSLERSYERIHHGLVGALALTWIFLDGGAVATPLVAVMAGVIALRDTLERALFPTAAAPRRTWWRPAASLVFIGLVTALLAAPRLVPVMQTLIDYPRTWNEPEGLSVFHVSGMLFLPPQTWSYYSVGTSYVGLLMGVAFVPAMWLRSRAMVRVLVAGLFTFDLAMGESGPLHLWDAMHLLPVVDNVRAAFRFTFFLALFVGLGGGRTLTWIELWIAERIQRARVAAPTRWSRRRALAWSSGLALAVTIVVAGHGPWATRARIAEIPRLEVGPEAPGPFRQALGNRWIAQVWPRANLGSIACFEEQYFPQSPALRGDRKSEEWLAVGTGTVERLAWSPNAITLAVDSLAGGIVAVNQNAARGWTTDVGAIADFEGLLAVRVPAGRQLVTLRYREPHLPALAGLSLGTLAALIAWAWLASRRGRPSPEVPSSVSSPP